MRTFLTLLLLPCSLLLLSGQTNENNAPDTLLFHTFEGILDPADTMLNQPSGYDQHWVNYDQDNRTAACVFNAVTPKGWYWESDLGFINPNMANNDAFTSCSYLTNPNHKNRNWLITSPIYIPDDSYWLCWRSLTYYGPDFMDGYKVLVSKTSNFPTSFVDTLFVAAETIQSLQTGSLDLNDYIFSPGYIHANGYTDDAYFFIDFEGNQPFYHGKMEPHSVSLANFAGQNIYIAFLHDSHDDFQLQVDDILVFNQGASSTTLTSNFLYFNILPNPVRDVAFINWKTQTPQEGRLSVFGQAGQLVFEQKFNAREEGQVYLDVTTFAAGVYRCHLQTNDGQASKVLVKL